MHVLVCAIYYNPACRFRALPKGLLNATNQALIAQAAKNMCTIEVLWSWRRHRHLLTCTHLRWFRALMYSWQWVCLFCIYMHIVDSSCLFLYTCKRLPVCVYARLRVRWCYICAGQSVMERLPMLQRCTFMWSVRLWLSWFLSTYIRCSFFVFLCLCNMDQNISRCHFLWDSIWPNGWLG